MDTNEAMRQQVLRLIDLGVTQAEIAKRMGTSVSWLSRWVNQKRDAVPDVREMDLLHRYLEEMRRALEPGAEDDRHVAG